MKNKPLIGILGGMGTYSGLYFQNLFFEVCNNNGITKDQDYPEWIYLNASMAPDRTEAICYDGESPIDYLTTMLKILESSGVDILIITCNTAHYFINQLPESIKIPWLNLQKETVLAAQANQVSSVALMSTEGTLKSGSYKSAFQHTKIDYKEPGFSSENQRKITSAIYNPKFGIKATGSLISEETKELLEQVIGELEADTVIAGCTELSLAFSKMEMSKDWLDPLRITAESLFDYWSGKKKIKNLKL